MATNKDKEIFYGLKKIQDIFRIPMNKVKDILVAKGICYLDGKKTIPHQKFIDDGVVTTYISEIDGNVYYKFRKDFILAYFEKTEDKNMTPMTFNEAIRNLLSFKDELEKYIDDGVDIEIRHYGISGFEHEVENYLYHLNSNLSKFSKEKIIVITMNFIAIAKSKRCPYKLPM